MEQTLAPELVSATFADFALAAPLLQAAQKWALHSLARYN